jgi:hypothetical protein
LRGGVRLNKKVSDRRSEGVLGRTDLPPLIQGCSAVDLEIVPAVEVSLLIEVVVDRGVN